MELNSPTDQGHPPRLLPLPTVLQVMLPHIKCPPRGAPDGSTASSEQSLVEVVSRAGTCQPHPLPIPLLPGQDGWSWIKIQHAPRSHERYHTVSEPCHTENLPQSITYAHSLPTATMPSPQSPPIAASHARIEREFFCILQFPLSRGLQ